MDRQNSSANWLRLIVAVLALVTCSRGVDLALADDGADSLAISTNNKVIDLSTNDGGDSTGKNSGGGSGNQNGNTGGNGSKNQGNNNKPPPCVPPPQGMLGGVANLIGVVVNPCK